MDSIIPPDSAPEPRPDTQALPGDSTTASDSMPHPQGPALTPTPEKESSDTEQPEERHAREHSDPIEGHADSNSDSEGTTPTESDPSSAEPSSETPEPGSIEEFALRAQKERLPADDETRAGTLLSELLLGGRSDVARAVACIPRLPWIVVTNAATKAWPEMKATLRTQMLAGLAKSEGEAAARIRLSLARGLFKIDQAAALKLIILTVKSMRDRTSGLLNGKGAAHFAGVLIGRGKAWILQVSTESLKPAEVDLLVQAALHGAFHAPQPPLTQIQTIKWAESLGGLPKISEPLEQLILNSISRWSSKWQGVLKREIKDLPEKWLGSLKQHTSSNQSTGAEPLESPAEDGTDPRAEDSSSTKNRRQRHPVRKDTDSNNELATEESSKSREEDEDSTERGDSSEVDSPESEYEAPRRHLRGERPVYVSKTIPSNRSTASNSNEYASEPGARHENQGAPSQRRGNSGAPFNLHETLRQIESYASGLRAELAAAQKQLRNAEESQKRARRPEKTVPAPIPGSPSVDELNRLNQQLEFRNAELMARIEEMTLDSEERATSRGLAAVEPIEPGASEQLKTLLAFKLQEDFEDFQALQQQAKDIVVQQHYKTVIQHVFEVLQAEGIPLTLPK